MTDTPEVTSYSDPEHIATAHESGMTFESAMDAVRNGYAVKRESWYGAYFIAKILCCGRAYIAEYQSAGPGYGSFAPFHASENDLAASDWKVFEQPSAWDQTDPRYEGIQL